MLEDSEKKEGEIEKATTELLKESGLLVKKAKEIDELAEKVIMKGNLDDEAAKEAASSISGDKKGTDADSDDKADAKADKAAADTEKATQDAKKDSAKAEKEEAKKDADAKKDEVDKAKAEAADAKTPEEKKAADKKVADATAD